MRVSHLLHEASQRWTVSSVIENILGKENVWFEPDHNDWDPAEIPRNTYTVGRSWTPSPWMFSDMDCEPGEGAICVPDRHRTDPASLAKAAHEAYHALLHSRGKNDSNEHVVNRLTARWVRDNLSSGDQPEALRAVELSRRSYKGRKYTPSRQLNRRGNPRDSG